MGRESRAGSGRGSSPAEGTSAFPSLGILMRQRGLHKVKSRFLCPGDHIDPGLRKHSVLGMGRVPSSVLVLCSQAGGFRIQYCPLLPPTFCSLTSPVPYLRLPKHTHTPTLTFSCSGLPTLACPVGHLSLTSSLPRGHTSGQGTLRSAA